MIIIKQVETNRLDAGPSIASFYLDVTSENVNCLDKGLPDD